MGASIPEQSVPTVRVWDLGGLKAKSRDCSRQGQRFSVGVVVGASSGVYVCFIIYILCTRGCVCGYICAVCRFLYLQRHVLHDIFLYQADGFFENQVAPWYSMGGRRTYNGADTAAAGNSASPRGSSLEPAAAAEATVSSS